MGNYSIEVVEKRLFASTVADEIVASIQDVLSVQNQCSLVLSGGKTPGSIYRVLSRPPCVSEIDWPRVHIFWGDERWVATDAPQSNYRLAHETLLRFIEKHNPNVHPVNTALGSPEEGAAEYAQEIIQYSEASGKDGPGLDIVLLGLGTDGHTASLFPGVNHNSEEGALSAAVIDEQRNLKRVTLLPNLLFSAGRIIMIVSGDAKADIVRRVLEEQDSTQDLPAKQVLEAPGKVTLFLDSAAASKLEKRP